MSSKKEGEPHRRFTINERYVGEIVLGSPEITPLRSDVPQTTYPGEARVSRKRDGKVIGTVPLVDTQFAIFGVHEQDTEVQDIKATFPRNLKKSA